MGSLPWYKEGLNFKCTECGKCCTGSAGYVWITEDEIEKVSNALDISVDLFKRRYTRRHENRYALVEKKQGENYACVFLEDKKCKIYQARPLQCRSFPWWQENLNTKESWELAAKECEGIDKSAPLVSYSQILEWLSLHK